MTKPLRIDLNIYPITLVVFFGSSIEEIVSYGKKIGMRDEYFTKDWIKEIKHNITSDSYDGFAADFGEDASNVMIWLIGIPESSYTHSLLVHEISHIVDRISCKIDSNTMLMSKYNNSEPRAYLFGYIFEKITDFIEPRYQKAPQRKALKVPGKSRRKSMKPPARKS